MEAILSKQEFLATELAKNIKHFNDDSTRHKNMYRLLRYIAFTFSAGSTILAGIALAFPHYQTQLNIAILFASAAIGVASSIEGLRRPHELWVHERSVLYDLRDVERNLAFHAQDVSVPVPVEELYARMQVILQASRDRWRQNVERPQEERKKLPGGIGG